MLCGCLSRNLKARTLRCQVQAVCAPGKMFVALQDQAFTDAER